MGRPLANAYLLDTSTLLWALSEPTRLSRVARRAFYTGPRVLSVASYWEIVIKSRKGLLNIPDPVHWWARASQDLTVTILSIQPQHITALSALPDIHRDPFDRMLIAQAIKEGLTILTDDSAVRCYPAKTLW